MPYLSSTVSVTYIFSVDYWRNIDMIVRYGSSTVIVKIVPFESFGMFLPCDAMHKRGLCRHVVSVCVSVCPSVTFVYHVKNEQTHLQNFFTVW